ncbi:hypothetical protein Csp2054_09170 [Curtobacterium sp. 'Ferrero']|uniref:hypothetical protein n=1 Tax=Curtobacterium sp. 'Ferrero' TaxID=2033654 RepID=UPI000BD95EB7|nr:hypothetical protein [Curtobacterium sp. 'Ferrero']PCN48034.1 hypothetical protein Csp2054_09170 [Curtobacterium sp. 'Ferrero']
MATEYKTLVVKRGSADEWAASTNPLESGEWGLDETNGIVKMGDGFNLWPGLKAGVSADADGQLPDAVREALAANLVDPATPEGAAVAQFSGSDDLTASWLRGSDTETRAAAEELVTVTVSAQVPAEVAAAIAADPTVADAAADAVTNALVSRNVPEVVDAYDRNLLWSVVDKTGRRTALELDGAGNPTPRMAGAVASAGALPATAPMYSPGLAVTDSNGRIIPDAQYGSDGTFAAPVVARLVSRLDAATPKKIPRMVRRLPSAADGKLLTATNTAAKFMLGTWIPGRFPGTAPITPTDVGATGASTDEGKVRHPCAAAFSVAALIFTGTYDSSVTGVTLADAKAQVLRVIKGIAKAHQATTAGGWGRYWQSSAWAQMLDAAAWMMGADVDSEAQGYLNALVPVEADFVLSGYNGGLGTGVIPYWTRYDGTVITPGDSKAEENAWMGGFLAWAATHYPSATNAAAWQSAAYRWLLSAGTVPSDILTDRTVQGVNLTTTFDGWNVNQDGSIINHDRLHPDYMCSSPELAWSAGVLWAHAGKRIPDAFVLNAEKIYRALAQVSYGGRSIYTPGSWELFYPQGNDWGTGRMADKAMADVVTYCMGLDSQVATSAADWADLHLQRCLDMQNRFTDGHTYLNSTEDTYSGAEPWVARNLALGLLAARMPTTTRYTYASIGA